MKDDLISRSWLLDVVEHFVPWDTEKDRNRAIHHVRELAPSVQQWIPCSEKLPESPFGCLVTVWDTNPITMEEFENILPYFVGWDGEQWNDGEGDQCPFEVIAWWPVP